jgi:hypothetical protein
MYDRQDAPPAGPSGRSTALPASDPALDFFSPRFDPLRALLAEGLLPPLPAARPLDTVHRCRFMLPPGHPDYWQDTKRAAKSKVRAIPTGWDSAVQAAPLAASGVACAPPCAPTVAH